MSNNKIRRIFNFSSFAVTITMLSGCGGGGSSDSPTQPSPVEPSILSITPAQSSFGQVTTFIITGKNLTNQLQPVLSACSSPRTSFVSSTELTLICTPNTEGEQILEIKNESKKVLFNQKIQVAMPPSTSASQLSTTGAILCSTSSKANLTCDAESLGTAYGLSQDGEVQEGQKPSYIVINQNGGECVKDKVTGLVWEQKDDKNDFHDKDWVFTWYNSDSAKNGGSVGYEDYSFDNTPQGKICGYSLAKCNTQAYISALNANSYCGYTNWRLPTRMELVSIIDYGRHQPSINPAFTNTQSGRYWSSSIDYDAGFVYSIEFHLGALESAGKHYKSHIRAVRDDS